MSAERQLRLLLRALGILDLAALGGVLMPESWMAVVHGWLGMGEFPQASVVGYLARSASLMYVQHGAVFLFLSRDVRHYRRLITCMAAIALVSGGVMLAIDLVAGIPLAWALVEGPGYIALAIIVLWLQSRAND